VGLVVDVTKEIKIKEQQRVMIDFFLYAIIKTKQILLHFYQDFLHNPSNFFVPNWNFY